MVSHRPAVSQLRQQQQQLEQRKKLLKSVDIETKVIDDVVTAMNQIQSGEVSDKHICLQALVQGLEAIDRVLNAGDWESSLFLRNSIKPIKELRERIVELQQAISGESIEHRVTAPAIPQGKIAVYISLFQMEGSDLGKWTMQVNALSKHIQGRPVYRQEDDVNRMIRSKLDSNSDGYVVLAIDPSMVLTQQTPRHDRNNCELLTLSDRVARDGQVIEFVHQQKRYCWIENKLVLQD